MVKDCKKKFSIIYKGEKLGKKKSLNVECLYPIKYLYSIHLFKKIEMPSHMNHLFCFYQSPFVFNNFLCTLEEGAQVVRLLN